MLQAHAAIVTFAPRGLRRIDIHVVGTTAARRRVRAKNVDAA
jgi:hypothetical protein